MKSKLNSLIMVIASLAIVYSCEFDKTEQASALKSALLASDESEPLTTDQQAVLNEFIEQGIWKYMQQGENVIFSDKDDFEKIDFVSIPVYRTDDEFFGKRGWGAKLEDMLIEDSSEMFFIGKYNNETVIRLEATLRDDKWRFSVNRDIAPVIEFGKTIEAIKSKADEGKIFIFDRHFAYFKNGELKASSPNLREYNEDELLSMHIRQRQQYQEYLKSVNSKD